MAPPTIFRIIASDIPDCKVYPSMDLPEVCSHILAFLREEMLESTKPRMTSRLATLASTSHLSRAEELKGSSDERAALFSGNPFESTVIELASGSKTGLQNQPDAELTAPISKTKESLPS
ncbi:uncharacterized protein LOC115977309 [Quercus lobata]|uniref:uncharacterized protein LOC115977309 n=1 Tax=Quercus lobata TaxID=97700 RepID=UPI00124423BD|nr:uncharacterized protein LOC115977309 [Quercus lobata]